MGTKIEWVDTSWNPIIGCSKISPGCQNCFAAKMAGRLANMGQISYKDVVLFEGSGDEDNPKTKFLGVWNGTTSLVRSVLDKPYSWKKPQTIFVCSMGDLFHDTVDFNDILEVMYVIAKCPRHTFKILTKRPQRMHEFFTDWIPNPFWINGDYLPNVWLGVTAENQEQADKRIPILLDIPAAKRFVSVEPMLSEVSFRWAKWKKISTEPSAATNHLDGLRMLDWVITGSESGPGRRPMDIEWVRSLKNQCVEAEVPIFLKQMYSESDGKKIKMPLFDGYVWNQKPTK